jgi:hypothetical protein
MAAMGKLFIPGDIIVAAFTAGGHWVYLIAQLSLKAALGYYPELESLSRSGELK